MCTAPQKEVAVCVFVCVRDEIGRPSHQWGCRVVRGGRQGQTCCDVCVVPKRAPRMRPTDRPVLATEGARLACAPSTQVQYVIVYLARRTAVCTCVRACRRVYMCMRSMCIFDICLYILGKLLFVCVACARVHARVAVTVARHGCYAANLDKGTHRGRYRCDEDD